MWTYYLTYLLIIKLKFQRLNDFCYYFGNFYANKYSLQERGLGRWMRVKGPLYECRNRWLGISVTEATVHCIPVATRSQYGLLLLLFQAHHTIFLVMQIFFPMWGRWVCVMNSHGGGWGEDCETSLKSIFVGG